MSIDELFKEYKISVYNLADKLPQWNSDDFDRKFKSAISSLFEEAGELSGLVSKKRIRKNYWKVEPKTLEDYEEIRQKFIDEASDFLWVLTCSCYCLGYKDIDLLNIFRQAENEYVNYSIEFEQTLYDVFGQIFVMEVNNLFDDENIRDCLHDVAYSFGLFLSALTTEYEITFEELLTYNIEKLNNRYTVDGQRTDGK